MDAFSGDKWTLYTKFSSSKKIESFENYFDFGQQLSMLKLISF